jgi:hypothetical protein
VTLLPLVWLVVLPGRVGGDPLFASLFLSYNVGSNRGSVAVGDVNEPEVTPNHGSGTVSVLPGSGDVTFRARTDFGTGSFATSVAVGDLNRDRKPDLAALHFLLASASSAGNRPAG